MKIALVHDYLKEFGGAERVLEALHEVWPDAPVYTTVFLPQFLGPHRSRFEDWKIHTSLFQYVPFRERLISPLRIAAPFLFAQFDFSDFDVVIVSATGAYSPNGINKKSAFKVCYCHTPPRYLYGYATARDWKKNKLLDILGELANHVLRLIDFRSSQQVDYFVANSKEVQARIKKFYRKDSVVIYPPATLDLEFFVYSPQKKRRYFLAGGRLARPKHIDLVVETCTKLNVPLKVFGKAFAGYGEELRKIAGETVEFLGEVSDEEKIQLMKDAKAFILASEDEDFGITPIEAMSVGTPVVSYRSGGVIESIVEDKTGVFFDELTGESLIAAIKRFEKMKFKAEDCIRQAQKFSKERFKKEIKAFVEEKFAQTMK